MSSIVLYIAMAVTAALLVMEHTVLAWRALRRNTPLLIALMVPAVSAWRAQQRGSAVRYAVWLVAYVTLAIVARKLALR